MTSRKKPFLDMEYSANVTLPAMSCLLYSFHPKKTEAAAKPKKTSCKSKK